MTGWVALNSIEWKETRSLRSCEMHPFYPISDRGSQGISRSRLRELIIADTTTHFKKSYGSLKLVDIIHKIRIFPYKSQSDLNVGQAVRPIRRLHVESFIHQQLQW
jgi:hypothetical protein